jgi:hypothetical protein
MSREEEGKRLEKIPSMEGICLSTAQAIIISQHPPPHNTLVSLIVSVKTHNAS